MQCGYGDELIQAWNGGKIRLRPRGLLELLFPLTSCFNIHVPTKYIRYDMELRPQRDSHRGFARSCDHLSYQRAQWAADTRE